MLSRAKGNNTNLMRSHMFFNIWFLCEGPPTNDTLVRFLTRVCPNVLLKVKVLWESFPTILTVQFLLASIHAFNDDTTCCWSLSPAATRVLLLHSIDNNSLSRLPTCLRTGNYIETTTIAPDKRGTHIIVFLFLHKNVLWVLIRSISVRCF